jgi:hypothetical protein
MIHKKNHSMAEKTETIADAFSMKLTSETSSVVNIADSHNVSGTVPPMEPITNYTNDKTTKMQTKTTEGMSKGVADSGNAVALKAASGINSVLGIIVSGLVIYFLIRQMM